MRPQHGIEAGLAIQAAESLRCAQRTFSRAQVAVLIALAFDSGYEHGREHGHDEALQDLHAALKRALGGEHATTMRHAVGNHITALDQKRARDVADHAASPHAHGPQLDDPDWPPVTVPDTKPTDTSSRPTTAAPHHNVGAAA